MSEIRKYVELIESNEHIEEGARSDARETIESNSYNTALHVIKAVYMEDSTAYNHWKGEIKTFVNEMIRKNLRGKIKRKHAYEYLSSNTQSIQIRNKMITSIQHEYGYRIIDSDDVYRIIDTFFNSIADNIDSGELIDYNYLDEKIVQIRDTIKDL